MGYFPLSGFADDIFVDDYSSVNMYKLHMKKSNGVLAKPDDTWTSHHYCPILSAKSVKFSLEYRPVCVQHKLRKWMPRLTMANHISLAIGGLAWTLMLIPLLVSHDLVEHNRLRFKLLGPFYTPDVENALRQYQT